MWIGDCQVDNYTLEVYECECGFHLGIDATYLEQVKDTVEMECPSCGLFLVMGSVGEGDR